MKEKIQVSAGGLSLLALLAYTMIHTGGLLAKYIQPGIVGYVAAFGIELAVVSLSLRIGELRKSNQDSRFFLFVLISVVVVSAVANVAEGFATSENQPMTLSNLKQLDILQSLIGLSATGLISLIVLALSEIIGTDVQAIVKQSEKERRAIDREMSRNMLSSEGEGDFPYNIEQARAQSLEQVRTAKAERLTALEELVKDSPGLKATELARMVGISRTTVYSYLDELKEAGRINGTGLRDEQ